MHHDTTRPDAIDPRRLVFVGGLHRSGTTLLGRIIGAHPECSSIEESGVREDEGQHLQRAYLPASAHGGPGRFARHPGAHLLELPPADQGLAAGQLLGAWTPYWDLSRHYLVEKSPPNMIMGRYLQSIFSGSRLFVIIRHPVIVALSTKKWQPRTTLTGLVKHWFRAHQLLREDAEHLDHLRVLRYEDLIASPEATLRAVAVDLRLTNTPEHSQFIQNTRSDSYARRWAAMESGSPLERISRRRIIRRFAEEAHTFGYDLDDVSATPGWTW